MKFKIFSLSEKWYKIVTALILIGVTAGCFLYYNKLEDKGDSFIIATIYAAFLFIVGLYLSYMSNSISNKLFERKNEYIMLSRLNGVFAAISLNSFYDISGAIIVFQAFTGRVNSDNESCKETSHIKELGFSFQPKLQKTEDSYQLEYNKLKELGKAVNENIDKYIVENKIMKKPNTLYSKFNLLDTNYEDWCDKYISEESSDKKEALIQFIRKTIDDTQIDFRNLEDRRKQLVRYYGKCSKKIHSNLKRMKNTYGNRLESVIITKQDILAELEGLPNKIESIIKSSVVDTGVTTNECNNNISKIIVVLKELQDNIAEEIQDNILMLEEDLGVEFDVKEKCKEIMRRRDKISRHTR